MTLMPAAKQAATARSLSAPGCIQTCRIPRRAASSTTFSVTAGKLPDGLELAPDGALTGTPAKAGTFAFTVGAANGITPDATLAVTLAIAAPPPAPAVVAQVVDPGLPPPTAGVNFNLEPVDGVSKVKCADEGAFDVLTEPKQVPIDCQVDASQGVVKLTSSTGDGGGTLGHVDASTHVLLVATGAITAVPLVWFTHGARRLPLTTLGILQYLAPTLQFLLAVLAFHEPFALPQLAAFALIWTALVVFTVDARAARRRA